MIYNALEQSVIDDIRPELKRVTTLKSIINVTQNVSIPRGP